MNSRIARIASVIACVVLVSTSRRGSAEDPQPKTPETPLQFRQNQDDLMITMKIDIVDAPHVLWTQTELVEDTDPHLWGPRRPAKLSWVRLSYFVIQCRDDPAIMTTRHRRKQVEVKWRISGHRKAAVAYRPILEFRPSAQELVAIAPKLKSIAAETRRRSARAVP